MHRESVKTEINIVLYNHINHILNQQNSNCFPSVHSLHTELDTVRRDLKLTQIDVGSNANK